MGVGPLMSRFTDLGKYSSRAYDFNLIAFLIKIAEHVCTLRYKITKIKFKVKVEYCGQGHGKGQKLKIVISRVLIEIEKPN